jgi:membrane-associated phospholipid phosphatase
LHSPLPISIHRNWGCGLRITTGFLTVFLTGAMALLLAPKAWTQDDTDHKSTDTSATKTAQVVPSTEGTSVATGIHDVSSGDSPRAGFAGHFADFLGDQKQIWTSPARARWSDATWLVPLGGITAGLFVTDRQYSASLSQNPTTISHYKTVSNYGVASLIGAGAGVYLLSFPTHNEHWRETGFLAGEAALNSLVTVEALKYSLGRERPYQGNGSGPFFQGGTSFPSEHSAAAWSIAGVFAHEYQGTLPKLFAYGMASAVSFSRVRARQHFPSDVLVGSVLGFLISESVYRRRHDPEIGGGSWDSPREFVQSENSHTPEFMGSPYVPLDSWIYPAIERLAALGYVKTAILGLRPWTRLECARLLSEASDLQAEADGPSQVQDLYRSLSREFQGEAEGMEGGQSVHAQIESVYAGALGVSGRPLTDNEHFGQTILNNYGRPYQEGFNSVVGTSGWTTAGPFVIYARGEYQSAASAPSLSPAALNFISSIDRLPSDPPAMPIAATSRFRLLDAYVGMNLANWQISFGKQSLWWGPGEEGAMLYTNNAEPLSKMFRINRVSPFRLPWVFGYLGDIRTEWFIGQVSGYQFLNNTQVGTPGIIGQYGRSLSDQPMLTGGKISFKFTPNFELSISKTTLFGGTGNPVTLKTLVQATFAVQVQPSNEHLGDGRSALDFNYRIPKLRNWVSFYADAFQEDEISPLNRPYKSAFQGGLYLVRFPGIPKLDFRVEGGTTSPVNFPTCVGCYYSNGQYLNGYTNNGVLIGTWVGRAAQGEAIRSNYWLGPQKKIGIELRHRTIDPQYLPQGGTQNDIAVNGDFFVKSGFRLSGTMQYERWQIPLLATGPQSNLSVAFQFGYWPTVHSR